MTALQPHRWTVGLSYHGSRISSVSRIANADILASRIAKFGRTGAACTCCMMVRACFISWAEAETKVRKRIKGSNNFFIYCDLVIIPTLPSIEFYTIERANLQNRDGIDKKLVLLLCLFCIHYCIKRAATQCQI